MHRFKTYLQIRFEHKLVFHFSNGHGLCALCTWATTAGGCKQRYLCWQRIQGRNCSADGKGGDEILISIKVGIVCLAAKTNLNWRQLTIVMY